MQEQSQQPDEADAGDDGAHAPPSLWPMVSVVGGALATVGLVHNFPIEAQVGLVAAGSGLGMAGILGWLEDDRSAPLRGGRRLLLAERSERPAPYSPPPTGDRSETEEALHLRVLRDIAESRFNFPTEKHGDYQTYVNRPKNTMGVQMPGGSVAYPDVVVVQSPENYTKVIAQVETEETVSEDEAFYLWGPYAELAPLYLYVPVGKGDETVELCRRLDVRVVGVRTWRYNVGYGGIEINDHYTV